ncbi:MAG: enoyl-CoA hydratase/isomerase family protein [Deltaproteobacteria bacterium]|nr:enoyl-CoA hydratase/isomerase family protein [Deltaproteobacteria bacterium]
MAEPQILVRDVGRVRELTLSRPDKLNALNDELLRALAKAVEQAERDGVRALILRGDGERAFSAGYDLGALPDISSAALPDAVLEATLQKLDAAPFPILALVNGHAFGGGLELAARCDVRIGVANSKLGMPPAKLGIVYAPRGLARFWALLGPSAARRLFFTGEPIPADEALRLGLLDEVLPSVADASARAWALAEQMAQNAPLAVSGMRRIFGELEQSLLASIDEVGISALRRESFDSADAREGRQAFLEKRAPQFRGL